MEKVLEFKQHLVRLGYGKSSIGMLPNCLKEFLEFTPKSLETITQNDIQNYYEYLQERPNKRRPGGLSEMMINHHIFALKLFFNYQLEMGNILENPISGMKFKTPYSKPREILTFLEIEQLYSVAKTYKERLVLSLFYGCGLRRSEGEKLDIGDVSLRKQILYVRSGKGGKRRAVPMSESVKKDIENYLEKERFGSMETALVLNRLGNRMLGQSYNLLLKSLLVRAEITKEITLHCLRHSIATHLLESGLSIEKVRDFLGHKNLESTQIYTRLKLD